MHEVSKMINEYENNGDGIQVKAFNDVARGSTQINYQRTVLKIRRPNDDVVHKVGSNGHIKPTKQIGGKGKKSTTRVLDTKSSNMQFSREKIREIFKCHDSNNDGFLNKRELTKAFAFLGSMFPFNKACYAMVYADANEDSAFSPLPFPVSLGFHRPQSLTTALPRFSYPCASLSSSSSESGSAKSSPPTDNLVSSNGTSPPFVEPTRAPDSNFSYAFANPSPAGGSLHPILGFMQSTESSIERVIFDFRFLALLAVGGSLAGSFLCFLNGCVYICDAYKVYWSSCVKGIHTGQMVLRLVEAIDVYLAGTVMLIFGMGLYGLFISNVSPDEPPPVDRALKGSSLFGMFALKERPKWMKISSLDELKTKVGHVIVMILLVKMFERSKMVTIATGLDLLSYSVCIFLSSASLYILHNLHRPE